MGRADDWLGHTTKHRVVGARFRVVTIAALVTLASVFASCGEGEESTDPGPITEPDISEQPESSEPEVPQTRTQGEREAKVVDDASILVDLLNEFWTNELKSAGLTFDPPDKFEYYRGPGGPQCSTQPFATQRNAYYCNNNANEFVAFDMDWFQEYLIRHPGGATTFLILAHEWGHAVQDTWLESGGTDIWEPAYRRELNADCLAGVFIAAGLRSGQIIEETGDSDAIFNWLAEEGGPWLDPGTHGTNVERTAAFEDGLQTGTNNCREKY